MSSLDGKPMGLAVPPNRANRDCGTCTLCCKLLPVVGLKKPRDEWCQHCDKSKGCAIYASRPNECRLWECFWKVDADQPERLQPRKTHCVFDCMIDEVNDSGTARPVFQLWVDTAYPGAFRAPAVLEEIDRLAKAYGMATLVRVGYRGILMVAPCLHDQGDVMLEIESKLAPPAKWGETNDWQVDAYKERYGREPDA